ncbi:hypothetical protein [Streptomyces sp. NPDC057554]|uniref:hypothetical protein n=1 Tax=Streptomyces sp. NPDC057554 TaxID=3350538 RepID=UPI0036C78F63
MDTEEATTAAKTPPAADGSRWFYGCSIAVVALFALFALAAHAVTEFEKSLDGDGQMEQPGRSGSAYEPLGPGATARYEDGLRVTVSRPEAHDDGTYSLAVTYENGTDEELALDGDPYSTPLAVRAGEAHDEYATGYTVRQLDGDKAAAALAPPLAEDDERTVPILLKPSRKGIPVTVEVTPPDTGYRETAHFQLTLG